MLPCFLKHMIGTGTLGLVCKTQKIDVPRHCFKLKPQAVALLAEMPTRRVKPDVVCFGAAIFALGEVAGTQNQSTWGRKEANEGGGGGKEEDAFFSRFR